VWEWLGGPLAVDFANTRRRRGAAYRELLGSGADLAEWAWHEGDRVPPLDPATADARLDDVRALRDEVCGLLQATVGGVAASAERVNAALRAVPLVPQLRRGEVRLQPADDADPLDELLARVAASAVELATAGPGSTLALCDAPSCGRFFLRRRRDQVWCSPVCGTRARVARHAAQRRERSTRNAPRMNGWMRQK
jgi:predicted RNA-binding Zn ribbon-like protein